MRRMTVAEMKEGSPFAGVLLVKEARLLPTRTGRMYMDAELVDRTGRVKAKLWEASREDLPHFAPDSFLRVVGHVESYRDELQLVIRSWEPVPPSEIDLSEFMPVSRFDAREMIAYLRDTGDSLEDRHLRELWRVALYDEAFMAAFSTCPAAISYHHVFLGGLLEHTCEVVRLADCIAGIRREVDRDLLLTGALFHDVGKTAEYSQGPTFRQLDRGLLLGHINIGAEMLYGFVSRVEGFPRDKADLIAHMILSHHGSKEFGSPVEPATVEAILLHYLDNIDAKMEGVRAAIASDQSEEGERFTRQQSPMLKRRVFKPTYRPLPEGYSPFAPREQDDQGGRPL